MNQMLLPIRFNQYILKRSDYKMLEYISYPIQQFCACKTHDNPDCITTVLFHIYLSTLIYNSSYL